MSENVVIMGAGSAGQPIARRLAARGIPLTLASRHRASLVSLAEELGADVLEADIANPGPAVAGARMLINTAGSFSAHAAAAAQACLTAGIPYLDISNELSSVTQLLALADQAVARGGVVVTGAGLGPAMTESLLLQLMAGQTDKPAAVRVALAPSREHLSPGTEATIAQAAEVGAHWYAGGTLQREPLGTGTTSMVLGGDTLQVVPAPIADLETARQATGAPDIIAYFSPAQGDRRNSYCYAELQDHEGGKEALVARLGIGIDASVAIATEIACRILDGDLGAGPGAWTPGTMYGPELAGSTFDVTVTPTSPDAAWSTAGAGQ